MSGSKLIESRRRENFPLTPMYIKLDTGEVCGFERKVEYVNNGGRHGKDPVRHYFAVWDSGFKEEVSALAIKVLCWSPL